MSSTEFNLEGLLSLIISKRLFFTTFSTLFDQQNSLIGCKFRIRVIKYVLIQREKPTSLKKRRRIMVLLKERRKT